MAFFRSRTAETLAAVQAKLDAAHVELAEAEQALADAALEVAMNTDPFAGERHYDRIRRAQEKVKLFEMALVKAEEAERQRLAEIRAKEHASELRAIRQRLSRL